MGFIKKYSYLRALFVGIPFGIACLVVGINQFKDIPKNESELIIVKGEVAGFGKKTIYDKEAKTDFNVYFIKVLGKGEYYAALGKHKKILKKELPRKLTKSKVVTIWYEKNEKYIEQISVGDELLIEYSPPYWIAHLFFWLGVVTLVSGVVYIVKHPEDLTGEKKN